MCRVSLANSAEITFLDQSVVHVDVDRIHIVSNLDYFAGRRLYMNFNRHPQFVSTVAKDSTNLFRCEVGTIWQENVLKVLLTELTYGLKDRIYFLNVDSVHAHFENASALAVTPYWCSADSTYQMSFDLRRLRLGFYPLSKKLNQSKEQR